MSAGLLPCPFCGGVTLSITNNGPDDCFVECEDCGARGPINNESKCQIRWNRRAEPEAQASGCTRSHPHEEMDSACKHKTVEARTTAQASAAPTIKDCLIVPILTPAEIDDMAFGYAPSALIGEARELILATISRIQALQNNGEL